MDNSGIIGVGDSRASGFVSFTVSPFQIINLLDGAAFPGYAAQQLQLYDLEGNRIMDSNGNDLLYLPFMNFSCLLRELPFLEDSFSFERVPDPRCAMSYQ